MQDLSLYWDFLKGYIFSRLTSAGRIFEGLKDIIVAFLIVKRGRYSSSFLNTSILLIVLSTFVAGPIIVDNSPFAGNIDQSQASKAAIVSYNPYENALETVVSVKPRSEVENYSVRGGDTLEKIAKRFDISVDTIKWANDMKTDVIKPGQSLKIPPITGVVHKVASGETIYTIAKKYNTDAQAIVNFPFNDFADLDTFSLTAGQTLFVPNGTIQEAVPTSPRFFAQIQAGVKGSTNFIWPTSGIVTQYPIWYHMALDIANPQAPTVIAADTGTVIYSGCITYGYGCHIIIDHGNGYQSLYGHLQQLYVAAGVAVQKGTSIGQMGSTGRSTGTHLHFEIRSGGVLLNPLDFLK